MWDSRLFSRDIISDSRGGVETITAPRDGRWLIVVCNRGVGSKLGHG